MKWFAIPLVAFGLVFALYKTNFSSYSYRYRLQLAVEIDGKVHTGSSVIEVTWSCGPQIADSGGCTATLGGQAAVVDLGAKGVLVATLRTGDVIVPVPDGAVDATFLCANAFGNGSSLKELPLLGHLRDRRDLVPTNFPRLVWFSNPADMRSARKVTLDDLAVAMGSGARVVEAYVEITRDPISIDIEKKLPWFPALVSEQKGKLRGTQPGQFQLIYNMFVGENS